MVKQTIDNAPMDFVPMPKSATRFGMDWLKYRLMKYPHVFVVFWPVPLIAIVGLYSLFNVRRSLANGTYVPNVVRNHYHIVRSTDYDATATPARYRN